MPQININLTYPHNPDYDYEAFLEQIDLDEERINDLRIGKGFIITEPQSIKKDIKSYNGIFSTRFGQTLHDINAFMNKWTCECKNPKLQGTFYAGVTCPICGTKVRYVGDEMDYFGWIVLHEYYIIAPNFYKSIEFFIGPKILNNIIKFVDNKNEDGFSIPTERPKDEPFYGIGMEEFHNKFEDIMKYYLTKAPHKKDYYDNIMGHKDIVFTQSIPVYTTLLRPFRVDGNTFYFEGVNSIYNILAKNVATINKPRLKIQRRNKKPKEELLYDSQRQFNELYKEIITSFSSKKGDFRSSYGGRMNYSTRCVIVSDPQLRCDQIRLPYHALVELLQQVIINILCKSYTIPYDQAYKIWYKSQINKDKRVYNIIKGLIEDSEEGLPLLIDRPPTIQKGSIIFVWCVGINDNYTMTIPVLPLAGLVADFDGDALSGLLLINKELIKRCNERLNPRNAGFISPNDGMFDNAMNYQRDFIIAACAIIGISRTKYTDEQVARIKQLRQESMMIPD